MTQALCPSLSDVRPTGIQRLNPRHMRLIELELAGMGAKDSALMMNPPMTPQNVSLVRASPLYQDELSRQRQLRMNSMHAASAGQEAQASKILQDAAAQAATTVVKLLDSDKPEIRLASAKDLLDRQGLGRGSTVPVVHITVDRLQLIQAARAEAKQIEAQVISTQNATEGSADCGLDTSAETPES